MLFAVDQRGSISVASGGKDCTAWRPRCCTPGRRHLYTCVTSIKGCSTGSVGCRAAVVKALLAVGLLMCQAPAPHADERLQAQTDLDKDFARHSCKASGVAASGQAKHSLDACGKAHQLGCYGCRGAHTGPSRSCLLRSSLLRPLLTQQRAACDVEKNNSSRGPELDNKDAASRANCCCTGPLQRRTRFWQPVMLQCCSCRPAD